MLHVAVILFTANMRTYMGKAAVSESATPLAVEQLTYNATICRFGGVLTSGTCGGNSVTAGGGALVAG